MTRVISRVTLQQILAETVVRLAGDKVIHNSSNVVGFEDIVDPVTGRDSETHAAAGLGS